MERNYIFIYRYRFPNRLPQTSIDEIMVWKYHNWIWLSKPLLCPGIYLFNFHYGDLSHSVLSIVRTYEPNFNRHNFNFINALFTPNVRKSTKKHKYYVNLRAKNVKNVRNLHF